MLKNIFQKIVIYLSWLNRGVEALLKPLACTVMFVMLLTVSWTVASRLIGVSAPWTEKIMLVLLPTLAFLVAPIGYRRSINVAMMILNDLFPPRIRALQNILIHLGILFLLLVGLDLMLRKIGLNPSGLSEMISALSGLDLAEIRPFRAKINIPTIGITWRTVFTVLPICTGMMILVNLELLFRSILGFFPPPRPEDIRAFDEVLPSIKEPS